MTILLAAAEFDDTAAPVSAAALQGAMLSVFVVEQSLRNIIKAHHILQIEADSQKHHFHAT
jgi:hypothetical protein